MIQKKKKQTNILYSDGSVIFLRGGLIRLKKYRILSDLEYCKNNDYEPEPIKCSNCNF